MFEKIFVCPECGERSIFDWECLYLYSGGYTAVMADGTYKCPKCQKAVLIYTGLGDNSRKLFPRGLPRKKKK